MKESYEARIQALEQKLKDAEAKAACGRLRRWPLRHWPPLRRPPHKRQRLPHHLCTLCPEPARSIPRSGGAAGRLRQPVAGPASTRSTASPSGDIAPAKRGFGLGESELGLSANVDDKIFGNLIFSLAPENTIEVEEAYGVLTASPYGLVPKFGRFFSGIGYLNEQHQHVWDFHDAPLAYQAFLGGQFRSDGLQLKWVAPTDSSSSSAPRSATANFPGADATGTASAAARRTSTPAATSVRAAAGARGSRTCGLRPDGRQYG